MTIANVALTDTFDQWRLVTNQTAQALNDNLFFLVANSSSLVVSGPVTRTGNAYIEIKTSSNINDVSVANVASINAVNSLANSVSLSLYNLSSTIGTKVNVAYDTANSKIASILGTSGRIVVGGSNTAVTVDLASSGAGAGSYTGGISAIGLDAYGRVVSVSASANYQPALGFTPIQQGGGTGQGTNKLYMGWSGTQLLLQVDASNFGATWPISISGSATSATSASFATAAASATSATNSTNALNLTGTQGYCGYSAPGQPVAYTSTGGPQVMASSSGASMLSFHRPGIYAVNFGLDTDNILKVGGWSMGGASYPILHSGNYNSYAPALTGTGASGTWGINITGNAGNGRTLLNTINLNNSAAASDITSFSSSYTFFDIELVNVIPVTTSVVMYMRVYSGGAFQTTMYAGSGDVPSNYWLNYGKEYLLAPALAATLTWPTAAVSSNTAYGGVSGTISVANPVTNTTSFKLFRSQLHHTYPAWYNAPMPNYSAFQWQGSGAAITGFQLFYSAGNIASGQVRIYGRN